MSLRSAAAIFTLGAVAAIVACGAFDEEVGPPTTGGQDAATADAPVTDAPTPGDGGADALQSAFCQGLSPKPAFCKDFDDGKPVAFGFIEAFGDVALDDASVVSPPASMRATSSAAGSGDAFLHYRDTQSFTKTHRLGFDVFVGALDGGNLPDGTVIARMREPLGADCSLEIVTTSTDVLKSASFAVSAVGDAGRQSERFQMSAYPVAGKWSHVEIVLEQQSDAVDAIVDVDGTRALGPRKTRCPALTKTAGFHLGAVSGGDAEMRFDNVVWDGT